MNLTDIKQITEEGLKVFMPSGIQATLFHEGKNIIVEYPNLQKDKYSINKFKKIMDEGIFIFSEQPTIAQQSVLMESTLDKLAKKGIIRESLAKSLKEDFPEGEMLKCIREIKDIYFNPNYNTNQVKEELDAYKVEHNLTDADLQWVLGEDTYFNLYNDDYDEYDESLNEDQKTLEFLGLNIDDFNSKKELKDYIENNTDYKVVSDGDYYINITDKNDNGEEIMINLDHKLSEAYDMGKGGSVYTGLKNKKKELLTVDFKNELLTSLDKIAREYPNVKVRQQALTFMDELGLQEYYDIKAVKDFCKKYLEIISQHVNESMNEGMWASPFTLENARKVKELLSKPITFAELDSDEGKKLLWNVIGDDKFWDEVADEAFDLPEDDARLLIVRYLEDWMENKDNFNKDSYNDKAEEIIKKAIFMFNGMTESLNENNWQNVGTPYYVTGLDGDVDGPFDTYQDAEAFIDSLIDKEGDRDNYSIIGEEEYNSEFGDFEESLNETLKDKIQKIINDKKLGYYIVKDDGHLVGVEVSGDWKHDHAYFNMLMRNNGINLTDEESIDDEDLGGDSYKSIHYFVESLNEKESNYEVLDVFDRKERIKNYLIKTFDPIENYTPGDMRLYIFGTENDLDMLTGVSDSYYVYDMDNLENTKKFEKELANFIKEYITINESLNEENGILKGNPNLENIANNLNKKEGYEPNEFGNWKLLTSLDNKWNKLTDYIKQTVLDDISDIILEGHLSYDDLEFIFNKDNCDKEDLKSLDMFKDEEINAVFENDLELNALVSYELQYDGKIQESFKVKDKKKKKKKLDELNKEVDTMKELKESCYKVYNTIENQECGTFDSWNDVEAYLDKEFGTYSTQFKAQNPDFVGTCNKDEFLANYEFDIVQVPNLEKTGNVEVTDVEVKETPNEKTELDPTEEKPEVENEIVPVGEPVENEQPETEDEFKEVNDPIHNDIENVEPERIGDKAEVIEPELDIDELINEMCMQGPTTPEKEKVKQKKKEEKNEEFEDNMGMLTDINDLDFPDALEKAVDTKEDGSLYRISDISDMIKELKAEIESLKDSFKSELAELKQGIKDDVKDIQNDVTSKLDNTDSKISDLTSEEENLEELEEEPIEEEPVEEETEEEVEEEKVEEAYDEKSLIGNPIYENIKEILVNNKKAQGKMSIPTLAEELREGYGHNTHIESMYENVSNIATKTSLKKYIVDVPTEKRLIKESYLGKAASWLKSDSLMNRMQKTKQKEMYENIDKVKQEIDKLNQEGKQDKIQDTIKVLASNDQEKEEAENYALDKVQNESKVNELLSKLKSTQAKSALNNLRFS